MQLGNFSANMIGNTRVLDLRSTWSNEPAPIGAGHLALGAKVDHPDTAIVLVFLPSDLGHFELRQDVGVEVTGDSIDSNTIPPGLTTA